MAAMEDEILVSSGSEWEDTEVPPPVIFAGVSSPGSYRVKFFEKNFKSNRLSARTRRASLDERSKESKDSSVESPLEGLTPMPSSFPKRLSVSSRSSRVPAFRRNSVGSDLKNQISELEAALTHSSARESLLADSLDELKRQIKEKDQTLHERQSVISTLEQEHRIVKTNFRDLMDATLGSADVEMDETPTNTPSIKPIGNQSAHTLRGRSTTIYQHASRRTHSVPSSRVQQTEDLLASLEGTNGYARQMLKRNCELEARCDELESQRDTHLREVYLELHRCRAERQTAEIAAERMRTESGDVRQHLADLHNELQLLHEKGRKNKDATAELAEARAALSEANEMIAAQNNEVKRSQAEWEAKQEHYLAEIEMYKNFQTARGGVSVDSESRRRNAELEMMLEKKMSEASAAARQYESQIATLRSEVRTSTQKLIDAKSEQGEMAARIAELEGIVPSLKQTASKSQEEMERARAELARLSALETQTFELESQLDMERQQNARHAAESARHLEAVKVSNLRFSELIERNSVLDKLLQRQQKEKEKLLGEHMETHERLYNQADTYRQKLEAAAEEISELQQKLVDHAETTRVAVESVEVARGRDFRQLREEQANEKFLIRKEADSEIAKLREIHSTEMSKLRELRDGKLETVIRQYETHLTEMKAVQERRLKDFQDSKCKDESRIKDEFQQSLAELQSSWRERLMKERQAHAEEMEALTISYQENLQSHLRKKTEENESIQRSLEAQKSSLEEALIVTTRKIDDAVLQGQQMASRARKDAEQAAMAALNAEKDRGKEAVRVSHANHGSAIRILEEGHKQTISALERKFSVASEKIDALSAEVERLSSLVTSKEKEIAEIRSQSTQAEEAQAKEYQRELRETQSELELLRFEHAALKMKSKEGSGNAISSGLVDKLNERIEMLIETNTELEKRLQQETDLLRGQLTAKDERINCLQTSSQHTSTVLERNSQLEESVVLQQTELTEGLQRQNEKVLSLESELVKLRESGAKVSGDLSRMKSEISDKNDTIERLTNRLEMFSNVSTINRIEQSKISDLESTVEDLRRRLALQSTQEEPGTHTRQAETLRLLNKELDEEKAKSQRLEEAMMKLSEKFEDISKVTLQSQLLTTRVESQEQTIQLLRERGQKKQEIVDDLKAQMLTLLRESETEQKTLVTEKQFAELSKSCEDLGELRATFEQERRSLEHRMELDRQLLTQTIDQKDRQLQQLIQTNQRAEKLFARNAELEEALIRLTNELETAQLSVRHTTQVEEKPPTAERVEKTTGVPNGELDQLRNDALRKDGEIRLLQSRLREMKARHAQELAEVMSKLRFASLEQSIHSPSEDDDLLKMLVEKTTELQKEVATLRKGRDVQLITLQTENEALKAAATSATPSNRRSVDRRGDFIYLESQLDTLEMERDSLRAKVGELIEALRTSSCVELSEVNALKKKNLELQRSTDDITRVVEEQRVTLDVLNKHAGEALRQNGSLRDLGIQMHEQFDKNHLLENIIKRNLELEQLLSEVQLENESERVRVSQRSTSATVASLNEGEPRNVWNSIQERLASVEADVSDMEGKRNGNRRSEPIRDSKTEDASTPSTSVGQSRNSPPSPPVWDSAFSLANENVNHKNRTPDDEGRARAKRPRTTRNLRSRSRTGSLPSVE